jgi:hypothetical protein
MRPTLIWFLASVLVALFAGIFVTPTAGQSSEEDAEYGTEIDQGSKSEQASKKPVSSMGPGMVPSTLLPTLKVAVDSCYVFLQPNSKSPYFGPLLKEEEIKRLDTYGSWIHVWIPRLTVTGWVGKSKVHATSKKTSSQEGVPEKFLSTLTVLTKRANVRTGPSTRARIIVEARQNQEFRLLNEKKGWYQIWIPALRQKGWVYSKIVAKKGKR